MLAAKCGRKQIETEHLPWQTMANQMINSDKPRTPKYTHTHIYIYILYMCVLFKKNTIRHVKTYWGNTSIGIPSGKHSHSYWKLPLKSLIYPKKWWFSIVFCMFTGGYMNWNLEIRNIRARPGSVPGPRSIAPWPVPWSPAMPSSNSLTRSKLRKVIGLIHVFMGSIGGNSHNQNLSKWYINTIGYLHWIIKKYLEIPVRQVALYLAAPELLHLPYPLASAHHPLV